MFNLDLNNRQKKIIELLKVTDSIKVNEFCDKLLVSPITIRRDLQFLESCGLIERFHGGAVLVKEVNDQTSNQNEDVKNLLAKKAAQYIKDNDTIFINSSSTAILILKYIKDKNITVITNNLQVVQLDLDHNIDVILVGGLMLHNKKSIVGDFASNMLSEISANKCFLGVSGISVESGLGSSVFQETSINRLMLSRCTGDKFIITESYKIGREFNFLTSSIKNITHIITDNNCSLESENLFAENNVEVIKAN